MLMVAITFVHMLALSMRLRLKPKLMLMHKSGWGCNNSGDDADADFVGDADDAKSGQWR